jgi:hypothetical protein
MTVMTRIENLIDELVSDGAPRKVMSRLQGWALVGSLALFLIASVVLAYSLRYDLSVISFTLPLAWKMITTALLAVALTHVVLQASQPQYRFYAVRLLPAGLAAAAFFFPALMDWMQGGMPDMALAGFKKCLFTIGGLGLVQLLIVLLWLRHGAVTHAASTGYLAGAASGAWASFSYSFYCGHDEMYYAGTWYTLATLGLSLVGGLIAPRICKW